MKLTIITSDKLRNKLRKNSAEATRRVDRPYYKQPSISKPRQYARLLPSVIEVAQKIGVKELARRANLPEKTVEEILAPY